MQQQAQDAVRPQRGVGGQLSRSSVGGWGKASSRLFASAATTAAPTPIAGLPDSSFCAMPEASDSSSTCRTSSPSPRMRGSNPDSSAIVEETPNSNSFAWIRRRTNNNNNNNTRSNGPMRSASPDVWGRFRSSRIVANGGGAAGAGRELAQRSVKFRIFVVYRGGWCTSSGELLEGENGTHCSTDYYCSVGYILGSTFSELVIYLCSAKQSCCFFFSRNWWKDDTSIGWSVGVLLLRIVRMQSCCRHSVPSTTLRAYRGLECNCSAPLSPSHMPAGPRRFGLTFIA